MDGDQGMEKAVKWGIMGVTKNGECMEGIKYGGREGQKHSKRETSIKDFDHSLQNIQCVMHYSRKVSQQMDHKKNIAVKGVKCLYSREKSCYWPSSIFLYCQQTDGSGT